MRSNRIGTDLMLHILTTEALAIYLPLENNCYTQLCGVPLFMVEPIHKVQARQQKRKRKDEKAKETEAGSMKRRKPNTSEKPSQDLKPERTDPVVSCNQALKEEAFNRPPVMVEIMRNRMFYSKWGWSGNRRLPCVGLPIKRKDRALRQVE
jgi:hypothetical protein